MLEQVSRQAQTVLGEAHILDEDSRTVLSDFCLWLYQQPNGKPIQIFGIEHWIEYQKQTQHDVDFQTRIVPARLLTQISEAIREYHFLHLSFQEFFIAKAALTRSVNEMIDLRFNPTWRSILPFYGTLLVKSERHEEFSILARAIADPPDVTYLMLIEVAQLFYEAGITDTRPILGYDLAELLWQLWTQGDQYLSDAALEALWRMPIEVIRPYVESLIDDIEVKIPEVPLNQVGDVTEQWLNPYMIYAGRRDGSSEAWLIDHFLNVDHEEVACFMVDAVAAALTVNGRKEISVAANGAWNSDCRKRFVKLLATAHHPDFIELIGHGMACLDISEEHYHTLAFALGHTGGLDSLVILQREFSRCLEKHVSQREPEKLLFECVEIARFMLIISAQEAISFLSEIRDDSEDAFLKSAINRILELTDSLNQNIFIDSLLSAEELDDLVILIDRAMIDMHNYGMVIDEKFMRSILSSLNEIDVPDFIFAKAINMDRIRVEHNASPVLKEFAISWFEGVFAHAYPPLEKREEDVLDEPRCFDEFGLTRIEEVELAEDDPREALGEFSLYLATLGYTEIVDKLLDICDISNVAWSTANRYDALTALAILAKHTTGLSLNARSRITQRLTISYFSDNYCGFGILQEAAAWTIGCWSIKDLFKLRDKPIVYKPLCRLSSEKGYLIYDDFYVEPQGTIVNEV